MEVLGRLLKDEEQLPLGAGMEVEAASNGQAPTIPPNYFKGKKPTQAYRDLLVLAPGEYTAPKVVDAFQAGGMEGRSRTQLLQAVHSVIKRDRDRRRAEQEQRQRAGLESSSQTNEP